MKTTTMTSRGRLTVPAAVRQALGLRPGDRVVFELDVARGTTTLHRLASISDAYATVAPRERPEDFASRREEFERGLADEATGNS